MVFSVVGWLLVLWNPVFSSSSAAGEEDFSFLSLGFQPRPAGLCGAYTALAEGPGAMEKNPAGLKERRARSSFAAGWGLDPSGTQTGSLTGILPLDSVTTLGAGFNFLRYWKIEEIDASGHPMGSSPIQPFSGVPSLSYASALTERFRWGATVKFPLEYLGDFSGSQWAWGAGLDAGVLVQPGSRGLTAGAAILNWGRVMRPQAAGLPSGGSLPAELRLGAALRRPSEWRPVGLLDLFFPQHGQAGFAAGTEFEPHRSLVIRAGTRWSFAEVTHATREFLGQNTGTEPAGVNAARLAGGVGVRLGAWEIDYAAQWWQAFGIVNRVGVRWAR